MHKAFFIILLAVVLTGCGVSATHRVFYKVEGDRAEITYKNGTGATENTELNLPWQVKVTGRSGQFLYVSAANRGSGPVTCKIMIDGEYVTESTAVTKYGIATCNYKLP